MDPIDNGAIDACYRLLRCERLTGPERFDAAIDVLERTPSLSAYSVGILKKLRRLRAIPFTDAIHGRLLRDLALVPVPEAS